MGLDVVTLGMAKAETLRQATKQRRGMVPPNPAGVRLFPLPTVMASPPTVTVGVANAGTSIPGSTQRKGNHPALTYLGAGMIDAPTNTTGGYADVKDSGYITTQFSSQGRFRVEFETDGDKLEFLLMTRSTGTNTKYRLWVDGQMATALPQSGSMTSGGAFYRLLVDFGSRGNRRIMLEGQYLTLISIFAHPTVTLWRTNRPTGPRAVWVGDSFSEGTGANWWWDSWAMRAGQFLGWDVIPSAVGATGYLNNGGVAGKVKYRDRFASDVAALNPDIVVFSGGYNDTGGFTAAAEQTEATALYDLCRSSLPGAAMFVVGNNAPRGISTVGTEAAFRDALKAAATGRADLFIDPIQYPNGESWITGGGKVGGTLNDGNADFYTSSDAVHPSQAGHDYLGRRVAADVARWLDGR